MNLSWEVLYNLFICLGNTIIGVFLYRKYSQAQKLVKSLSERELELHKLIEQLELERLKGK